MDQHRYANGGYITLITTLLVGAVGLVIVVAIISLGIGGTKTAQSLQFGLFAKGLANACTEEALQQIRTLSAFTGSGNLTIGSGTCSYTVTNTGGTTRTVTATGTYSTVVRKVNVSITAINPKIIISSWQEVP